MVPTVPAAASVWQLPHSCLNSSSPRTVSPPVEMPPVPASPQPAATLVRISTAATSELRTRASLTRQPWSPAACCAIFCASSSLIFWRASTTSGSVGKRFTNRL